MRRGVAVDCGGSEGLAQEVLGPLVLGLVEGMEGARGRRSRRLDEDDRAGDRAGEDDLLGSGTQNGTDGREVLGDGQDFTAPGQSAGCRTGSTPMTLR